MNIELDTGPFFWAPAYHPIELQNTPSRQDIDYQQELLFRSQSVDYIFKAGRSLRL